MQEKITSRGPVDVVRAWKDEEYKDQLSEQTINIIPPNPAGELASGSDSGLENLATQGSCSCYPLYCT